MQLFQNFRYSPQLELVERGGCGEDVSREKGGEERKGRKGILKKEIRGEKRKRERTREKNKEKGEGERKRHGVEYLLIIFEAILVFQN